MPRQGAGRPPAKHRGSRTAAARDPRASCRRGPDAPLRRRAWRRQKPLKLAGAAALLLAIVAASIWMGERLAVREHAVDRRRRSAAARAHRRRAQPAEDDRAIAIGVHHRAGGAPPDAEMPATAPRPTTAPATMPAAPEPAHTPATTPEKTGRKPSTRRRPSHPPSPSAVTPSSTVTWCWIRSNDPRALAVGTDDGDRARRRHCARGAAGAGTRPSPPTPSRRAPAPNARAQAKAQVKKGQLDYKLARFEEALEDYTHAYELYPAPALLFNLGQCHRNLKNYERAIFFFEGYLREQPKIDHGATRADRRSDRRVESRARSPERRRGGRRRPIRCAADGDAAARRRSSARGWRCHRNRRRRWMIARR